MTRPSEQRRDEKWKALASLDAGTAIALDIDKQSDFARALLGDCIDLSTGRPPEGGLTVIVGKYRGVTRENEALMEVYCATDRKADSTIYRVPKDAVNGFTVETWHQEPDYSRQAAYRSPTTRQPPRAA